MLATSYYVLSLCFIWNILFLRLFTCQYNGKNYCININKCPSRKIILKKSNKFLCELTKLTERAKVALLKLLHYAVNTNQRLLNEFHIKSSVMYFLAMLLLWNTCRNMLFKTHWLAIFQRALKMCIVCVRNENTHCWSDDT